MNSELLLYAQRISDLIVDLHEFYDPSEAITWIDSPQAALGGQRPAALLMTADGNAEVRAAIGRLRDGSHG